MKKLLFLFPILAALTACGGGGGNGGGDIAATDTTPAPVATTPAPAPVATAPAADAFTGNVSSVVGMSSDTAEPVALDASAASMPEDSEPTPVS
ncbi:hypothetical protein [Noviherbaspirillum saxi]|uniref:Uncharacterized protein n=1 Tax=Noviherbaspirillum saxi TaxID=2320863 RepID=A0A3A3G7J8_9BURK|nr:hypothetical protein [Noviherbaspirillum saxi]RJF98125.1 hypothetical protein D3871_06055 [Noviherbaspirillum saxi]